MRKDEARRGEAWRRETRDGPKKGSVAKDAGEAIETACGVDARGFRARGRCQWPCCALQGGLK